MKTGEKKGTHACVRAWASVCVCLSLWQKQTDLCKVDTCLIGFFHRYATHSICQCSVIEVFWPYCYVYFHRQFVGCRSEKFSILKIPIVVFDRRKWRHVQITIATTTSSSNNNTNNKIVRFNAANYFRCCIFQTLLFKHTALILFIFLLPFFCVCREFISFFSGIL